MFYVLSIVIDFDRLINYQLVRVNSVVSPYLAIMRRRQLPVPQVNNPLYETGGPIYEEIPGEKNFNTLMKPSLATPTTPSSEYVTMEGRLNGERLVTVMQLIAA